MATDSISLGELDVSSKILVKQLKTAEKDIIAFQRRIDKVLKWELSIDDSKLRRQLGRAIAEFDRLEQRSKRATESIGKSFQRAMPNIEGIVAKQSAAIQALYQRTIDQAKQFGATMIGETAKARAGMPSISGKGGGVRQRIDPTASADLLKAQENVLKAQTTAREMQETRNRRLILAAERQLSQAKIALMRQEVVEINKTLAARLAAVKGEAAAEIRARTDAARHFAAKERQIQNETRRDQNRGKMGTVGRARFAEDVTTVMEGLRSGSIAGIAAMFGPMGAAAGIAFDIIKDGFLAVAKASNEFHDGMLRSQRLLVGNSASIKALGDAMQTVRFSARDSGVELNELQRVFELLIGSVPELQGDMGAVAAFTDKIGKAAVATGASTEGLTIAMTGLANSFQISLKDEENQTFMLDRLSRLMIDGVIPNADQMANMIGRAATNMAALSNDSKQGIDALMAMNAVFTLNGINIEVAQDKINDLNRMFQRTSVVTKMVEAGLEGVNLKTGKVEDWGKVFASAGKDVEKFAAIIPKANTNAQMALRLLAKGNAEAFKQMLSNAENSGGTANAQFMTMHDTAKNQMDRLKTEFNDLLVTMGEGAANSSKGIVGSMASAISWINDLLTSAEVLNQRAQQQLDVAKKANEDINEILTKTESLQGSQFLDMVRSQLIQLEALSPAVAHNIESMLNASNAANPTNISAIREQLELIATVKAAESVTALNEAVKKSGEAVESGQDITASRLQSVSTVAERIEGSGFGGIGTELTKLFGGKEGGGTFDFKAISAQIKGEIAAIEVLLAQVKPAQLMDPEFAKLVDSAHDRLSLLIEDQSTINAAQSENAALITQQIGGITEKYQNMAEASGKELDLSMLRRKLESEINETIEEGNSQRDVAYGIINATISSLEATRSAEAEIEALLVAQFGDCVDINAVTMANQSVAVSTIEAYIAQKQEQLGLLGVARARLMVEQAIAQATMASATASGNVAAAIAASTKLGLSQAQMTGLDKQILGAQTGVSTAQARITALRGEKKAAEGATNAVNNLGDAEDEASAKGSGGSRERTKALKDEEKEAKKIADDKKKREEDIAKALDKINADRYQSETKRKASGLDETEAKLYEEERRYQDQLADLRKEFGEHSGLMAAATALHMENISGIEQDAMLKAKEKAEELEKEKAEHRKEVSDKILEMEKDNADAEFEIREAQVAREVKAEAGKYTELIKMAKKYGGDVQAIEKLRFQGIMRIYRAQITELTQSITGTMEMIFPKSALMAGAAGFDVAMRERIGIKSNVASERDRLYELKKQQEADFEAKQAQSTGSTERIARETFLEARAKIEREAFALSGMGENTELLYKIINAAMKNVFGAQPFEQIDKDSSAMRLLWENKLIELKQLMEPLRQELEARGFQDIDFAEMTDDQLSAVNSLVDMDTWNDMIADFNKLSDFMEFSAKGLATQYQDIEGNRNIVMAGRLETLTSFLQGLSENKGYVLDPETGHRVSTSATESAEHARQMQGLWENLKKVSAEYNKIAANADEAGTEAERLHKIVLATQAEIDLLAQKAPGETLVATVTELDNWLSKLALVINEHRILRDEIAGINQQYDNISDEKQGYLDQFQQLLDLRTRAGKLTRESGEVLGGSVTNAAKIRANYQSAIAKVGEGAAIAQVQGNIAAVAGVLNARAAQANISIQNANIASNLAFTTALPVPVMDSGGVTPGPSGSHTLIISKAGELNIPPVMDGTPTVALDDATIAALNMRQAQISSSKLAAGGVISINDIMNMLLTPETTKVLTDYMNQAGEEFVKIADQTGIETAKLMHDARVLLKREADQIIADMKTHAAQRESELRGGNQLQVALREEETRTNATQGVLGATQMDAFRALEVNADAQMKAAKERDEATTDQDRTIAEGNLQLLSEQRLAQTKIMEESAEALRQEYKDSADAVEQAWIKAAIRFVNDLTQVINMSMDFLENTIETVRTAGKDPDAQSILGAISSITTELTSGVAEVASKFGPMGEMVGGAIGAAGGLISGIVDMIASLVGGDMKLTDLEQATRENEKVNALLDARKSLMADLVALGDLQLDSTREQAKFLAASLATLESGRFGVGELTNEQAAKRSAGSQQRIAGLQFELIQAQRNAEEAPLFDRAYWENYVDSLNEAISMETLNSDALQKQVELRKELRDLIVKTIQDEANARDIRAAAGVEAYTTERAARENLKALNALIISAQNGTAIDAAGNLANFTPDEIAQMQADAERYRTQAEDARRSKQEFDREVLKHQQEMTGTDTSGQVKESLKSQIAQEKAILATLHGQDQIIEQKKVIMALEKQLLDMQKERGSEMDKELALLTKQREAILKSARADKTISGDEKSQLLEVQGRIRARLTQMGVDPAEIERIMNNMNLQAFESGGWVEGSGAVPVMAHGGERVLSRAEIAGLGGRGSIDALIASRYATLKPQVGSYAYSAQQSFGDVKISGTGAEDIWRQLEPRMRTFWMSQQRNYEKTRGAFRG